ncbi:MAG: gliding motility-associated C-terminal domain-containing protein [Flavobacteriaceae bacterium]|nr:gliding motility-associated C-terminal domain-containing protein [Flavobacteriaceae bacterium]
MDVDEVWVYTGSYTITQGDIDNGEVLNQATAEGTAPDGTVVSDLSGSAVDNDDTTDTDLCQGASIALIKTGVVTDSDGDKCADTKETIEYSFEVINTGNATLSNITIEDPLVNVLGGPITLAPGESDSTTFTATYIIDQDDIEAGQVVNQATVTGTNENGDVVSDLSDDNSPLEDDPTITELCQDAVIALIKVGTPTDENGDGCIDLGETIVYDFVVSNLGNVTLTDVMVTDPLVTVSGGPVSIPAGESDTETFTAIYTVTQDDVDAGFISNQATVEGTAPDGTVVSDLSDDNSVLEDDPTISSLCQDPMMSLEKTGVFNDDNGDQIPQVGETITYTFSVTNTGDVTLYNITIDDPLPGVVIEGGPIEVLEVGETDSTTFIGTYQITQEDIDNGEVINQAIATGEDGNGNEVEDDSDDPTDITNTDNDGDGDPDDPTVTDIPNVGGEQFEIFNGITPNGDGLNDFFEIRGITDFPNNNVKIFNRWGVLVFETDGYDEANNVFRGRSNARATISEDEELPTGTYFYVLTFPGENPEGQSAYNGYLYINR